MRKKSTRTHNSWHSMIQRCRNKNHSNYRFYGGRGIKVCKRWQSFSNFLVDMGLRPKEKCLDRIDNNGNYEPLNCRWATSKQQSRNARFNHHIEIGGKSATLQEWADRAGLNRTTIYSRLKLGLSVQQAVFSPRQSGRKFFVWGTQ